MNTLNELFGRLEGDEFRKKHPFSDDLREANELLHNPAAFEDEMTDCLLAWCHKKQPCQFGRSAAQQGRIHFCFLTHNAISRWSDQEIADKIAEEKKLWKQRAAFDRGLGAHSFMLVVASPIVALAAPDSNLEAFSNRLLELAGWSLGAHRSARRVNEISSDYLYLRNPADGGLYGFQFNVDFFACAAHERWWHDHRVPGGIAFTANSLGHMRAFRDWYDTKQGDGTEWAVRLAMVTIDNAETGKIAARNADEPPIAEGRSTWLRPLEDGKPAIPEIASPLSKTPAKLEGKDWTKYEGYLHTDHAVREEFFRDRPVPPTIGKPYRMDFTYIYAQNEADFTEFTAGRPFTEDEVYAEIGQPNDWTHRTAAAKPSRTEPEAVLVAEQLTACERWTINPRYVEEGE
jgi:hypothetical protein